MPSPETVLLIHNRYRWAGGEDAVFEAEATLLESRGHRVLRYERDNQELEDAGRLRSAANAVWNPSAHRDVATLVAREQPAVVHIHNTFAVASPAVHHAAHRGGAVVVQTLHNFRLICPGGQLLRDGAPCERCLGAAVPWRGVVHGCYRDDRAASALVAGVLVAHRALGTWDRRVDAFITLSRFARDRFVAGGLPAERLHVKSGFLDPDPGAGRHDGDDFLYVGRLSREKGVETLLRAWQRLDAPARLVIVGEGPLEAMVRAAADTDPRIDWVGAVPRADVIGRMQRARALVFPSLCYENFPTVLAEAFAVGLPVIAADIGSVAELVEDGVTGVRFPPGDAVSLAGQVQAWHTPPGPAFPPQLVALSRNARALYLERFTAACAYERLMQIYGAARAARGSGFSNRDAGFES